MDSLPVEVADVTAAIIADAIRFGSCSYSAAAATARTFATCYRCYLSSAAVAEAIRAATVPATPVATNSVLGGNGSVAPFFFQNLYQGSLLK